MSKIFDAIDDYARQLVTDMADAPPHVIFTIAVNGIDPPKVMALCRDGEAHDLERIRMKSFDTDEAANAHVDRALWTLADLTEASHMLSNVESAMRYARPWVEGSPYEQAVERRARAIDNRMADVMKTAAHEAAHPHVCPWCRRMSNRTNRFKTARGMGIHLRTCSSNPNAWDLTKWIPMISDRVTVAGGYAPGFGYPPGDEREQAAMQVLDRIIELAKQGPEAIPSSIHELRRAE